MPSSLTRRDLLTSLLGAPVALDACRRAAPARIAGSIRGPAMDVGHLLREAGAERSFAASPLPEERVGVAIVGAGPSGLSAAWRLDRLGARDFVVFDLEDRAGGTSRFDEDGVVPYPWGAHYVPVPLPGNRALVALLEEMGGIERRDSDGQPVYAEEQLVRAPEERIYYRGRWYEGLYPRAGASPEDLEELARFHREVDRWVAFRDGTGRRAFAIPMAHGSTDAEVTALDRISMGGWLDARGFRSARLRWLVDYACRDDYGLRAEDASAWAGIFYFASRVAVPGGEPAELLSWSAGNGRLVQHLGAVAKDRIRTGCLVTEIVPREDGVDIALYEVGARRLRRVRAEYLIFAAPKFVARHLLRPSPESPPDRFDVFEYGPWMVANLHLDSRPKSRGFPLAWDNVLYDSPSLGYVVATHQRGIDHGPTIWTYYLPFVELDAAAGRRRLLEPDHAAWCDVILADLGRAHQGLAEAVTRIDVFRWGHAMVRPRVGAMFGGGRERAAAPLGRIHFAHSDLSGVALFEEAQYRGVAAAEAVLAQKGHALARLAEPG